MSFRITIISLILLTISSFGFSQTNSALSLSMQLLNEVKENKSWENSKQKVAQLKAEILISELNKDAKRIAFWINIYNAFIQIQLKEDPKLYEDRGEFFSKESIQIGEMKLSFDDIEHQILRKAEWKYGFGYIKNPFLSDKIEKLEVEVKDFRIHFALNCGAKSCPKIRIYSASQLNEQLDLNAKEFLSSSSNFIADKKTVEISPLFSWFRGDFGGEKEVLKLLKKHAITPEIKGINIKYTDYDWTLKLNNYVTN